MRQFGQTLPLGSWVLLPGSKTAQILRDVAHQENWSLDVLAVNEMQFLNEGGFATPLVCVIIADTKAQVALSRCRNFKSQAPLAYVCCFGAGTIFIVWVCFGSESQFCSMGWDDIVSIPSFPITTRLWTPWGAPFCALCGH